MSAEIVKKRGRPKKVISDPIEVDSPTTAAKSATRAKSTKSAPKPAKAATTSSAKIAVAKNPLPKATPSAGPPKPAAAKPTPIVAKTAPKPILSKQTSANPTQPKTKDVLVQQPKTASASLIENATVKSGGKVSPTSGSKAADTPTMNPTSGSKILAEVEQLKARKEAEPKPISATTPSKISSKPSQTTMAKPSPSPPQPKSVPSPTTTHTKPIKSTTSPSPPPPPSASKLPPNPRIPIAAMNSEIVSEISQRAGARPNPSQTTQLPKGYKQAARKFTSTIVALPILLVTSYILYDRFVLGTERKLLVPEPVKPSSEG